MNRTFNTRELFPHLPISTELFALGPISGDDNEYVVFPLTGVQRGYTGYGWQLENQSSVMIHVLDQEVVLSSKAVVCFVDQDGDWFGLRIFPNLFEVDDPIVALHELVTTEQRPLLRGPMP